MGYQALLICPDEKTARTVTQVLTELEFAVEPCIEPFAAVKKLMGEHFDAVVVDCDNEQNATLLFKSAKNSAANQASLAVAVVEGQAGVAKAFRIGANLVLTKPINVEQAKGTLRVARGLLRKGEPGKPAAPAAPAPPKPVASAPAAPKPPQTLSAAAAQQRLTPKPAPAKAAWPAPPAVTPAASSAPVPHAQSPTISQASAIIPEQTPAVSSIPVAPRAEVPANLHAAHAVTAPVSFGSGAASAPAPARIAPDSPSVPEPSTATLPEPASSASLIAPTDAPAPSFTFGGANAPAESGGGSKKILLTVAAAAILAAVAYLGWSQFGGKPGQPTVQKSSAAQSISSPASQTHTASLASSPNAQTSVPASNSSLEAAVSQPETQPSADTEENQPAPSKHVAATHSAVSTKPGNAASTGSKPAAEAGDEPAEHPIVVKNGSTAPLKSNPASPDVSAPAMTGMTTGSGGSLPNLLSNTGRAPAPVLQTLNVSQGVSQGLIVKRVQPTYPSTALHMRMEGAVQLLATISKAGDITSVKILSGEPLLTHAAADAVKQWKYKPYLLNGEPVEIQTQITVNFKLPK